MLRKPFLIIPSSGDWILAIGSISEGNKSVDVHAKTQRKRHAKSAQLHFVQKLHIPISFAFYTHFTNPRSCRWGIEVCRGNKRIPNSNTPEILGRKLHLKLISPGVTDSPRIS